MCPVLSGSGTRLKALEAMAQGLPLISTTLGVEGIELRPEEHFLRADTAEEFALGIRKILGDPERTERMRWAARRRVESIYSWEETLSPALRDLEQLLA